MTGRLLDVTAFWAPMAAFALLGAFVIRAIVLDARHGKRKRIRDVAVREMPPAERVHLGRQEEAEWERIISRRHRKAVAR